MLDQVPGVPRQPGQVNIVFFYMAGNNLSSLFSELRQEFIRANESRFSLLQPRPHFQFYDVEISDPTEMPPIIRVLDADYILCNQSFYNLYLMAVAARPDMESDLGSAILYGRRLFGRQFPAGFLAELPMYDRPNTRLRRLFLLSFEVPTETTQAELCTFLSAMCSTI
jgi:hypothetical protein